MRSYILLDYCKPNQYCCKELLCQGVLYPIPLSEFLMFLSITSKPYRNERMYLRIQHI